jgi:hypothetical protein
VFLLYRIRGDISGWVFEEAIRTEKGRRKSERLPDVVLTEASRSKVVEFGGAYPPRKLEAFHAYCSEKRLPYEVW